MTLLHEFLGHSLLEDYAHRTRESGVYPDACRAVLEAGDFQAAWDEITRWPGYKPTPLRRLDQLSTELGLAQVVYKDESGRFGLGSFKSLGGAYAVMRVVADRIEAATGARPTLEAVRTGRYASTTRDITVATATDGNHGRSVAWGARMAGARCVIYIHAQVSEGRKAAMEQFGAEVRRIDGDYDDSVRYCMADAEANRWQVVSDTSFPGYMEIPRHVMAGYGVLAGEIVDVLHTPPTHVFVQAGVGGIAAALLARLWIAWGDELPRFVIVEPGRAACVLESARRGEAATVPIRHESVMAGLSCGETSHMAWEILGRGASDFLAITEDGVAPAMRLLASGGAGGGPLVAGESAVPGVVALIGASSDPAWRERLGLEASSRVLLLGCEGATDPEIYRAIVGSVPD